jgi:SpoVK/Ycf46/Vps4 family AAA+-type ATPase
MLSSRRRFALPCLWLLLVSQLGRAFTIPDDPSERPINHHRWRRFSVDADQDVDVNADGRLQRNSQYIKGLQENLGGLLDKYICNGSPKTKERIFNVLDQIEAEAMDQELIQQSIRMTKRAGVPMDTTYLEKFTPKSELGKTDAASRRKEAEDRQRWEAQRSTSEVGSNTASNISKGRSALSRRATTNGKPDLFMPGNGYNPDDIANIANDKENLQKEMDTASSDGGNISETTTLDAKSSEAAANKVSEFVARAGAGSSFDGEAMGIGGLNDVLAQIKRRVWTPLAAPPQLLEELGIHPVRGLLLYGKPGCGKTLLARTLGNILSPMRPITVVSGPEVMDKFVGR